MDKGVEVLEMSVGSVSLLRNYILDRQLDMKQNLSCFVYAAQMLRYAFWVGGGAISKI